MTKTPAWRRYLRFWRPNIAADVDEELRFHTQMRVAEYMARGLSEEEARRAVAARLGDVDAARVDCIEQGKLRAIHARNADFLDGLRADIRYALRSLGRAPAWTAVALLTIALGVGATTAVFRVADTLLINPIRYPHASRIFIARRMMTIDGSQVPALLPVAAIREWRGHAHTINGAEPFRLFDADLGDSTTSVTVHGSMIDTAFLSFAGVHPIIGRNFAAVETMPGGPGAVLLSEGFWRRQYGGASNVLGKVVPIDGQPRTIVGVVPSSLTIPMFRVEPADIWLPLVERTTPVVNGVIVRLAPSVAPDVAAAELDTIFQRAHLGSPGPMPMGPRRAPGSMQMRLALSRPQDDLKIRESLLMLVGAVALLLLVACTNVAHLLLARGASRRHELAVRHALGAARRRLLRQLVTESLVLALFGGALAVVVGWVALLVLEAVRPADMVALAYVTTGRGILAVASILAIGSGLAIGLFAALRVASRQLGGALRAGAMNTQLGGRRLRAALVVGEVALSATLLVGALLLVHAIVDLQRTRLGFDARGLYAVTFAMPRGRAPAERSAFVQRLRAVATALPGVEGVTIAGSPPQPRYWRMLSILETPEHPASGETGEATATNFVAPDFFAMMRMPIIAGRPLDDGSPTRNEVIVSRSLARRLWPNESPLGRRFRNALVHPDGSRDPWQTVVGVVPDMVQDLLESSTRPAIYDALSANNANPFTANSVTLLVRLKADRPTALLRQFAASVEPGTPKPVIANVRESIDQSMAEPKFTMRVLTTFAALGILLAAIGLFGVISYSVGQRTREIGVRMTLGATRTSIARLVLGDGVRLAVIGIVLGLVGATVATRLIGSLLYGVSRFDPISFTLGAVLLLVVAIVACAVPTWRATAVDPVIAVRAE